MKKHKCMCVNSRHACVCVCVWVGGGGGGVVLLSSPCTAVVQEWIASSPQSTHTTFPHRVKSADKAIHN